MFLSPLVYPSLEWLGIGGLKEKMEGFGINLLINGIGLVVTSFILISVIAIKFEEGGWVTMVMTSSLIFTCIQN